MDVARPRHFFQVHPGETPQDVSSGIAGDVADIGDETRAAARQARDVPISLQIGSCFGCALETEFGIQKVVRENIRSLQQVFGS